MVGLVVSITFKLNEVSDEFPEASVTVSVTMVEPLKVVPGVGDWVTVGAVSQLSATTAKDEIARASRRERASPFTVGSAIASMVGLVVSITCELNEVTYEVTDASVTDS